ncbi:MAG: hypothetical protein Kow00111_15250 [Thermincola ferriacetica]
MVNIVHSYLAESVNYILAVTVRYYALYFKSMGNLNKAYEYNLVHLFINEYNYTD